MGHHLESRRNFDGVGTAEGICSNDTLSRTSLEGESAKVREKLSLKYKEKSDFSPFFEAPLCAGM